MKDDLISRQEAIDRINKQREHLEPDVYPQDKIADAAYRICEEFIERLPSAQPEQIARDIATIIENEKDMRVILNAPSAQSEIIRCKDCMHNGSFDTDCPIDWNGKEYCSFAERG